nr:hypothetical protein [Candidatus Sigynarchaeota archaeon]
MAQPDDLNAKMQRAVELIGEAEFYEQAGDLENCIAKYEEAAHLLSQSGFPGEKVEEIYNRINTLKQVMRQQGVQQAMTKEKEKESAEEEAFALIDQAELDLKAGDFDNALAKYQAAMPKLELAGYSTQHVHEKIQELGSKIRQRQVSKPAISPATTQPAKFIQPAGVAKPAGAVVKPMKPAGMHKPEIKPAMAPVEAPAPAEPPETTAEEMKFEDFKESREKIEEMETKAFDLIDEAKSLTEQEKYVEALSTYGIIKNLLKNAGWKDDQLEPILIQENLVKDIMETQRKAKEPVAVSYAKPVSAAAAVEPDIPKMVKQKLDLFLDQDTKMRDFKEHQVKRQNLEGDAFDLINQAQKLYKFGDFKDYQGAIDLYRRAIAMLSTAGWTDQVAYLAMEVEKLVVLNEQALQEEKMREEEVQRAAEEKEERAAMEVEKQQAAESNLKSISSMLGRIEVQKKKEQDVIEEESIKQKLLEEKRYKALVAHKTERSFDSLKDMLFGDKDAKIAADKKAKREQIEQEFLSNTSKKVFEFRKSEKEQQSTPMASVEKVVDFVHQGTIATQKKDNVKVNIIDPKKKQEQEVKQQQKEKDQAIGDVLSMLGAMKTKKEEKKEENKDAGVQDEELKKMFSDLKKKKQ